jgi:hypothetical protein
MCLTFPYYYNEIKNFTRNFIGNAALNKDGVIELADHAGEFTLLLLPEHQPQVIRPDHDSQQRFPPDQLSKCQGEKPSGEPEAAGKAAPVSMNMLGTSLGFHFFLLIKSLYLYTWIG